MQFSLISRILGILLMLFSLTQLTPVIVSVIYNEHNTEVFLAAFALTFFSGLILWFFTQSQRGELKIRDGFLITVLFWVVLCLAGMLPLLISEQPNLSIIDALFESVSGLTTTGATVITGLDYLPKSILFYRQQLQWLGGIGIVVIAVAILPMLGIGGMQLYRAEMPGPNKDNKLTPRITSTAKVLFYIYLALTALCTLAYWISGMTFFDAICHSFSTVAIGGFSTHDESMGYFSNPLIQFFATVFMTIAAINFALHFQAWQRKSIKHYIADPEFLFFCIPLIFVCLFVSFCLFITGEYNWLDSLLHGSFQTVSIASTTGFTTTNFSEWPSFIPWLLLFMAFMGGCAASTAGGIKAVRVMLLLKQGLQELKLLVYPHAVMPVRVKKRRVPDRVMAAVWGFFAVYIIAFLFILLGLVATGLSFESSFSAAGATLNNLGPGLGSVALNYKDINDSAKLILSLSMLLGRLEVFTLLVLFTPYFWRN